MTKKIIAVLLLLTLTLSLFAACGGNTPKDEKKLKIVCTITAQKHTAAVRPQIPYFRSFV